MPTNEKTHHTRSLVFDSGATLAFDSVASVGAGEANTTVIARLPLAQRSKIFKIAVDYSAIADTTGDHKVNIVVGTGAEGAVGVTDGIAPAGTTVFAADAALTNAADAPQVLLPANFDVIYDTGTLLTLRAVTPATTGSITNLKVTVFLKAMDAGPSFSGTTF